MTARRQRPGRPPLFEQLIVATRQLCDGITLEEARRLAWWGYSGAPSVQRALESLAVKLGCAVSDLRCDHEPALRVRSYNPRKKKIADRYTPHAHDPACLIWRPHGRQFAGSHDVKTNVRGDHGQFSDTALIKRERRREKASVPQTRAKKPRAVRHRTAGGPSRWPRGRKIPKRVRP